MGERGGGHSKHTTAVSGAAAAIRQLLHCPAAVPPDKTLMVYCYDRGGRTAWLGACAAAESWCIKAIRSAAVGSVALLDGCALCTKLNVSNATTHIKPRLLLRLRG